MNNLKPIEISDSPQAGRKIPIKRPGDENTENKKMYKAAKDMESLFMYHIIRAMRNTIPKNEDAEKLGFGDGLGKDIYTQLFDEELSKKISGNGEKSLANLLYKSLTKIAAAEKGMEGAEIKSVKEILPEAKYLKITEEGKKTGETLKSTAIPKENQIKMVKTEKDRVFMPLGGKKIITADPDQVDIEIQDAGAGKGAASVQKNKREENISAVSRYDEIINKASEKYRLEPSLIASIIRAESGGDTTAVSRAGAKGLMQLADTTASDMGVNNAFDPEENIEAGAKYLRSLLDRFGDLKKALAAYNAGPETVKRYGGIPPYPETKKYVKTVLANMTPEPERFE